MNYTTCVIIPSVGNSIELSFVLDSLLSQEEPLDEIIVVGPFEDLGRKVAEDRNIRYIDDKGSKTRADACNVAIEESESDIILFTDDDVIVPSNWSKLILRWFSKDEVSGVGGPNFAPVAESSLWQKVIDVTFCNTIFTSGTNYGKIGNKDLEEVDQLPGVNSAYRRKVIEEIGGFDKGSIGAEDVILDYKIRKNGNKLWSDKSAIIWHRRRNISTVKKQIRNYGLVRALASHEYPELRKISHTAVALFPLLVISSFLFFIWGLLNGGISWPTFWDIRLSTVPMGMPRICVHLFFTLIILYNMLSWFGSWSGKSPNKSFITIFLSPIVAFILHWNYGIGILTGWLRIYRGDAGLQIDDKKR
jgi:GT2 family glycosyltransferase